MTNYTLIDSFTKNQKFASITLLNMLVEGGEKRHFEPRTNYLKTHIDFLGLNERECDNYIHNIDLLEFQKESKSLNTAQIDLLLGMTLELLMCNGNASDYDFQIAENIFVKVVGITPDQFDSRLEKIAKLTNHFNQNTQNQSVKREVTKKPVNNSGCVLMLSFILIFATLLSIF